MSNSSGVNELVELSASFYDVLLGGSAWNQVIAPLLPQFDATVLHLLSLDARTGLPNALGAIGIRSESETTSDVAAYDDYYHKNDKRTIATAALSVGGILTCREVCDDAYIRRDEVYQDYLIPRGFEFLIGSKVAAYQSTSALFGILRSGRSGHYSPIEFAKFKFLSHHLGRAIQLQWRFQNLQRQLFHQESALNALSFGLVVVNGKGQIHHANREAENLFRKLSAIKVIQNRLSCVLSSDQSHLDAALNSVVTHGIGTGLRLYGNPPFFN